ncbi:3-phosphoshikimate 1-carboxyvinyltransferase [candidate division WOR-1 bacterium RIFCSPLOWO2_02_FULL_46_20]|uniref:3-phosphoshikimate 1-carboxyvinyltransferase n=1 Tax=candidate division WOR-1 bacterium RIFCSPLOWO2_02_FULL_46_20 TaxID=1802567 RepID=A0A1F4RBH4_UNCSA|nr:MAG: 3-phosphoshikimate 1-carboxyvinyltransferase [candidate division WOR-1 bacterium RIFCSPHIGHO2_02_FULL_45_12]OGC05522.1 MAG: 3-phosphoshikimate 1-carboxyvinyltransferase [candidate division WOR-1 bacterium RIFCSPLOWO2_02_FULL_46_20]
MAKLIIKPIKQIKAEIQVPGDKSISHRAIMIGSLANGETVVNNFLMSEDCLATVKCLGQLGIDIQMANDKCQMSDGCRTIIRGKGLRGLRESKAVLDVGNSGTTIRLLSGILAGQSFTSTITGDKSIQKRPMMRIVKPLRSMGATIEGREEKDQIFAPLKISGGKLSPIKYELPIASAQVKSAILLAGLFAEGETRVIEKVQARDHTERMLAYFGVKNGQEFQGKVVDVPGDLSSAAFFIVAALIAPNSELIIKNVGTNPTRTGIIEVLQRMGAKLEIVDEQVVSGEPRATILVTRSSLRGTNISGEIIPRLIDEIPIIAVAATQAQGITEISGARELRVKESDRLAAISAELGKMGAKIKELDDGMIIEGPTGLKGAKVKSYGDHRVAMSLTIAGLIADGETTIDDTACIETSFPGFEALLRHIQ